jgi:XdhC and CoxI family
MTAALALGAGAAYVQGAGRRALCTSGTPPTTPTAPGPHMPQPADPARRAETHDVLDAARAWLDKDGRVALATVVGTWGSSPVGVGGQMVVSQDGKFEGSVSGGCVEGEVITEAAEVIAGGAPKLLEFGVQDETAWRAGLACGGRIRIFVEPFTGE